MMTKEEILKHKYIKINGVLYSVLKKQDGKILLKKYTEKHLRYA